MSVVVTKVLDDEIVMVADSQVSCGQTAEYKEDAKVFQVGSITFGACGYARDGALLRLFCETHTPRSATCDDILSFLAEFDSWMRGRTNNAEWDSDFHIVYRGHAFYINGYYITEITKHHAIGSGRDYALGALHAGATPEEAVEAACALNIYCQCPVNVFRISREDEELT
jgi:ATP-dependent protease HslVU (ClpYQ) peptidase subunit